MAPNMRMKLKVRLFWVATLLATIGVAIPVFVRWGDQGWQAGLVLAPALLAWGVSRFWPRCPFCHDNVIKDRVDWIFPSTECPSCRQSYDGPFRTPEQLAARDHEEYVKLFGSEGAQ